MRCCYLILVILSFSFATLAVAQDQPPVERVPVDKSAPKPADNAAQPPRSDDDIPGESSSKKTEIDVSPPKNDQKDHPYSYEIDTDSDVSEFHSFDPHKAMKAIEVGDFYFKKENYKAAISRYQEALDWKPNDAEATYKLGEALEKSGDLSGAVENYQAYLKILPHGPYARKAEKALDRLKEKGISSSAKAEAKPQ
jgi:tetratricopeptide (TPR) repeat protein